MKLLRSIYFGNRFFVAVGLCVAGFIFSYTVPVFFPIVKICLLLLISLTVVELLILWGGNQTVLLERKIPERLSNGDENTITLLLQSNYKLTIHLSIIDEIPIQFQKRDFAIHLTLAPNKKSEINYTLRPVKRGEYHFGNSYVFVNSSLKLLTRRVEVSGNKTVPVYPSFIQMRKFELLAISNQLVNTGIKRVRKIGHNLEFELIKKYVPGDDARTVNWKAFARRGELMVNHYQDERSQQVYSLIDKGRLMQMPFEGMSLLDYAINASLVISNIAIKKSDKAGLITFQDKVGTVLQAGRVNNQIAQILQALYNQKTAYREPDFSTLFSSVRKNISQRSLLLLFTNFETLQGLNRQLRYLRKLAQYHLVVVIFFENTELKKLIKDPHTDLQSLFYQSVAEKLNYEKRLIVKELNKNGIHSILSQPQDLTINTINKYLELKARSLI
ncbi:MAG: DUF58 domain-containing protein [Bacteroidetes bacterium]|nr:DUF58 domain-containing protein [Bacteroidota bacterium]